MKDMTITLSRNAWGEVLDAIQHTLEYYDELLAYFANDDEMIESLNDSINMLEAVWDKIRAEQRRTI